MITAMMTDETIDMGVVANEIMEDMEQTFKDEKVPPPDRLQAVVQLRSILNQSALHQATRNAAIVSRLEQWDVKIKSLKRELRDVRWRAKSAKVATPCRV